MFDVADTEQKAAAGKKASIASSENKWSVENVLYTCFNVILAPLGTCFRYARQTDFLPAPFTF